MKIYQVFDSYPLFYQPYIPPVLDEIENKRGVNSKIIAYNGSKGQEKEVFILPKYRLRNLYERFNQTLFNDFKTLNYLEIKALKEEIDIIHIQHSFLFKKVINLLKRPETKRPKIVITLRGGDTYIKPWLQKSWRDFYKNYGKKVDAFIVMSEDQKEYLLRWGVPIDQIHVIPISFGDKFESSPKYPNKNKLKLVSVFRMCWEKNIADSLRLVETLKKAGIPVTYDIYGNGKDLGQLYYLRDKYNLINEVNIKGKVTNQNLKRNLKTYDFILQLSHSESLGMSIIEAQTFGVPGIVSSNGGLPELVEDEVNGIVLKNVVDIDVERIFELWKNKTLYRDYSANAINISQQKYNTSTEVDKLLSLYERLASN